MLRRCFGFFFFSSRRRHTRYWRDWSSDVCSSDLWLCVRRWVVIPVAAAGLLLVQAMDLWTDMLQSLAVVLVASLVAVVVGVPLGILTAREDSVRAVVRPVMDFMQTMPVFVYLLPAVFFFGIGVVPGVVATTIF